MIPNMLRHALFVAATVTAVGLASPSPIQAQEANSIVMKNFDFVPMALTVKAGTTVTWKNTDGEPHTVTSVDGLFRSGALDTDDTFSFKFDKPGTYKYACTIHPRMLGTVVVQ